MFGRVREGAGGSVEIRRGTHCSSSFLLVFSCSLCSHSDRRNRTCNMATHSASTGAHRTPQSTPRAHLEIFPHFLKPLLGIDLAPFHRRRVLLAWRAHSLTHAPTPSHPLILPLTDPPSNLTPKYLMRASPPSPKCTHVVVSPSLEYRRTLHPCACGSDILVTIDHH